MANTEDYNTIEITNAESFNENKEESNHDATDTFNKLNQNSVFLDSKTESLLDWNNISSDSPRSRYAELYRNIDEEEAKIRKFEERRKKLQKEMELFQQEIEYEKMMFREAIDFEIDRKSETETMRYSSIKETIFNPFDLDKENIKNRLQDCRKSLDFSKSQNDEINSDLDPDIERFKTNLQNYKKDLNSLGTEQISKEKRKAAEKVFQKHFQHVEDKCAEQIDYLENVQKSIKKDFSIEFCAKKL